MEHDSSSPYTSEHPIRAVPKTRNRRALLTRETRGRARGAAVTSLLLAVFAILVPGLLHAQERGEQALSRAEELVYSGAVEEQEFQRLLRDATDGFRELDSPARRAYNLGRVALLEGTYYNTIDEDRIAARVLEEALEYARDALEAEEFSEGYRLLADAQSQMMLARGIFYMARHGDEAKEAAFRALELNPENPKAHISVAGYYLNAPPIAGGDTAEGVALLEKGIALEETGRNDRFLMSIWLTEGHRELGNLQEAESYLRLAEEIYPRSPRVESLRREL